MKGKRTRGLNPACRRLSGFCGAVCMLILMATEPVPTQAQYFDLVDTPNTPVSPQAIADLNNDAIPDLVGANAVSLGYGDGTFSEPIPLVQPDETHAERVAVGNLDGDAVPDLVLTFPVSDSVVIRLGAGDGTFGVPIQFPAGEHPIYLTTGDFNGDGASDVVAVNGYPDYGLSVLMNLGNGVLDAPVSYDVKHCGSIAVADLNKDGALDIVATNSNIFGVSVLMGLGDGAFAPAVSYPAQACQDVAVGDLDGDGWPDLVVIPELQNHISVLLNQGDGTFAEAVSIVSDSCPERVALGDLNHDAIPDVVMTHRFFDYVSVRLGRGDGTFDPAIQYAVGYSPAEVSIEDVNKDTHADLIVADRVNGSALLGRGDGTFEAAPCYKWGPEPWGYSRRPKAVTATDLNGDEAPDLVVLGDLDCYLVVLTRQTDGTFVETFFQQFDYYSNQVVVGELNGDSYPDLVVSVLSLDFRPEIRIYLGQGDGTFIEGNHLDIAAGNLGIGDFNNDALDDLVLISSWREPDHFYNFRLSVLLNQGDGSAFTSTTLHQASVESLGLNVEDFNLDGWLDIMIETAPSTRLFFSGRGDGTFAPPLSSPIEDRGSYGDLTGDGIPDLVSLLQIFDTQSNGTTEIWLAAGNGDGSFAEANHLLTVDDHFYLRSVGDLNRDRIPDLLLVPWRSGSTTDISVLLGVGDNSFLPPLQFGSGSAEYATLADLDYDYDLDVICLNQGGVFILENLTADTMPNAAGDWLFYR